MTDIWIEPHDFIAKHSICVGGTASYTSLNLTHAELVTLEGQLKKYLDQFVPDEFGTYSIAGAQMKVSGTFTQKEEA